MGGNLWALAAFGRGGRADSGGIVEPGGMTFPLPSRMVLSLIICLFSSDSFAALVSMPHGARRRTCQLKFNHSYYSTPAIQLSL